MSGYYVKRPEVQLGAGNQDFADLAEEFPAIAWALAGRPKDHEAGEACPATIMLFFDGGKLKYCLSPKIGMGVAFGTVDDPSSPMASIEASIREGKYEWKNRKRN